MLVSHRFKFIYTKTAKTAGTSVESYFEPFCVAEGKWAESHARDESVSEAGIIGYRGPAQPADCTWWNHMPAALIRARIGEEIWSRYFKFCVIRNPCEKVISGFYFFFKNNGSLRPAGEASEQEQLEAYLETCGPPIDRDKYLIDGKFCLDDVVRYKRLATDLERVCSRLNVPWNASAIPTFKAGIRPRNATAARLFTEKARNIVEAAYAFELDYFGYSFPSDDIPNSEVIAPAA